MNKLLKSNHTDKEESNKVRSTKKEVISLDDFMISASKENDLMSKD